MKRPRLTFMAICIPGCFIVGWAWQAMYNTYEETRFAGGIVLAGYVITIVLFILIARGLTKL